MPWGEVIKNRFNLFDNHQLVLIIDFQQAQFFISFR